MSAREKPFSMPGSAAACDAGDVALLTIDLGALAANYRLLAERAAPAECAAVVKADAYGLGLEPVMRKLLAAGCRTFFVATAGEAQRAREISREAAIYVFNGAPPGSWPLLVSYQLRPVLGSLDELAEWAVAAPTLPAALHIDTGMSRLGIAPQEAATAAELSRGLSLALVISHFVSSQQPENPRNEQQIGQFAAGRAHFPQVPASLANSSGIFLPQRPHFELARPGYALYGGNPTPDRPNPMRPVVKLEARVLALREIEAGETVGYDAAWTAVRPSRLATLGLGYADGLPRVASLNVGAPPLEALVSGFRCPVVGRVSMDAIVLDLTDAPPSIVRRGDFVELLGETTGVDALAERAGTIGYEILTRLGHRYARRYLGG
jgi:alanine racemase